MDRTQVPAEMRKRLRPNYRGKPSHFDFNRLTPDEQQQVREYKQNRRFETRLKRQQLREADLHKTESASMSQQGARKLFIDAHERMEEEQKKSAETLAKDPYKIRDCMRCLLQEQGVIFIPDRFLCECEVAMPLGAHTVEEEDVLLQEESYVDDLAQEMALIAAHAVCIPDMGSGDHSDENHKSDESSEAEKEKSREKSADMENPDQSITKKDVASQPTLEHDQEKCQRGESTSSPKKCGDAHRRLRKGPPIQLSHRATLETRARKVVIYAPPNSGKTTFQRTMFSKGVFVADSDLMEEKSIKGVRHALKTTSVLVSNPKLIPPEAPLIAFIPTRDVFYDRLRRKGVPRRVAKKWYRELVFDRNANRVECKTKHSFVSHWFETPSQRPEGTARIPTLLDALAKRSHGRDKTELQKMRARLRHTCQKR